MVIFDSNSLALCVSRHLHHNDPINRHLWIKCTFLFRVTQIKTYSWDNAQVILVGNKCDMEEERVVSQERGRQLAEQLGVEFYETSAKENINVKVFFLYECIFFDNVYLYAATHEADS